MTRHDNEKTANLTPPSDEQIMELIVKYADQSISEEELQSLNRLLESNARAAELFADAFLHASAVGERSPQRLRSKTPPSSTPSLLPSGEKVAEGRMRGRSNAQSDPEDQNPSSPHPPSGHPIPQGERGRGVASPNATSLPAARIAVATTLIVLLTLTIWLNRQPPAPAPPISELMIGRIVSLQGYAERLQSDGTRSALNLKDSLVEADDHVLTHGEGSVAVIERTDGSRFSILGHSHIVFSGVERNEVRLIDGLLVVSVKPQLKENPLKISTERARLDVLGTSFAVQRREARTEVDVLSGSVQLTDLRSGATEKVREGNRGTRNMDGELQVARTPRGSAEFFENFENGIPPMGYGEIQTEGLLEGSTKAAAAKFSDMYEPGHMQVSLHTNELNGLFRLTQTSHLELVCQFGHVEWVNIFMGVRDLDPNGAKHTLYKFNQLQDLVAEPGVWKRVVIPISALTSEPIFGSGNFDGPPPEVNGRPVSLQVSWPVSIDGQELKDRGFLLDSVRVLPDGSGKATAETIAPRTIDN